MPVDPLTESIDVLLVGVYLRVQYTARYRTRGRGTVEHNGSKRGPKVRSYGNPYSFFEDPLRGTLPRR